MQHPRCNPGCPPSVFVPAQIDGGGEAGRHSMVDSLNVSVATGILLHRLRSAQAPGGGGGAGEVAGGEAAQEAAAAGAAEAEAVPEL